MNAVPLDLFVAWARYSDQALAEILTAADPLDDAALDQRFDIGLRTLRRTLIHIIGGESVWLARIAGAADTPWPDQRAPLSVDQLRTQARANAQQRDTRLAALVPDHLATRQTYRDSTGARFTATLAEMWSQFFIHSIHHRAQAVNILRQLGHPAADMDYMIHVRQPATTATD